MGLGNKETVIIAEHQRGIFALKQDGLDFIVRDRFECFVEGVPEEAVESGEEDLLPDSGFTDKE